MSSIFTPWLGLVLFFGVFAIAAVRSRRDTEWRATAVVSFIMSGVLSYFLIQEPLGYPDPDKLPKGEFKILGAKIEVDEAIFVLLDMPEGPHLYQLPYTTRDADNLQASLDAVAGGQAGGVKIRADDQGTHEVYPDPVRGDEPKVTEQPMVSG